MFRRSFRSLLIGVTVAIAALAATPAGLCRHRCGSSTVGAWSVIDTSVTRPRLASTSTTPPTASAGWCASGSTRRTMKAVAGKTRRRSAGPSRSSARIAGSLAARTGTRPTSARSKRRLPATRTTRPLPRQPWASPCHAVTTARTWRRLPHHREDDLAPAGRQRPGHVRDLIYWYGAQMTNGQSGVQEKAAGAAWSPDF